MEKNNSDKDIFTKAFKRAIGGGLAGSSAMIVQITSLMWLRTTMNYQYKNGGTFNQSLKTCFIVFDRY